MLYAYTIRMCRDNVYTWKLTQEIINRSPGAVNFEEALGQWRIIATVKQGMTDCLCSYKNITNINVAVNIITNELVNIGSCCVKKFNINIDDTAKLKCCECNKPLPFTNKYVRSLYDSGVRMNKKTKVLGHSKCIDKMKVIYNQLIEKIPDEPTRGSLRSGTLNLVQQLRKYFIGIIDRIDIDKNRELVITLSGTQCDKYLQLLNII